MSVHFLAALAGALIATTGLGVLAARCYRAPSAAAAVWAVALLGLTVALYAQAVGYKAGFGPVAFRLMEVGAQAVAPLALVLGVFQVAGKSLAARFAAWLILSALAFVAVVILATDPLSSATFTKAWPTPSVYYQPVSNELLKYLLPPVTLLAALIGGSIAAARQGRSPQWRAAFPPAAVAAVAAILLAVPGLSTAAKVSLPLSSLFVVLCVLAAVGTWFAGVAATRLRLDLMRGDAGAAGRGPGGADDDEFGVYRGDGPRRGGSPAYRGYQNPGFLEDQGPGAQAGYGAQAGFRERAGFGDDAGFGENAGFGDDTGYRADTGFGDDTRYRDDTGFGPDTGFADSGWGQDAYAGEEQYPDAGSSGQAGYPGTAAEPQAPAQMFGQIAIYTLLEERVADFDRLTRQVVTQVRAHEPDTLVYIVHAVPSAPMQRILYEVYRDRGAYEHHRRQPYVLAFEANRRPCVLATNVIELGLQQAKVSPLPSVTDLLSDTGFDLLSDTGFGYPGYGPAPGSGGREGRGIR